MFVDDAWYVSSILVKEGEHAVMETAFEYNQWIKADDTGQAECEIMATGKFEHLYVL